MLVAAAEMALAGGVGLQLELGELLEGDADQAGAVCFGEAPGRYLLEIAPRDLDRVRAATGHLAVAVIGASTRAGGCASPAATWTFASTS